MELDVERKRKRTYSGGTTLTAQHVKENLHRYGEKILHCNVNITRGIRECGNTVVLKYVCGLLNSGGGILHMRNMDAERGVVLSKHLDTWWSGMEIKMAEILSRDDICNYFDLVGNHDDHDLFLFVKTAEHMCTLSYHCRLPTDTATHDVTYQSLMRLLVGHHEPGSLHDLPPVPDRYVFGRCAQELKKETKQIQFKQLSSNDKSKSKSSLPERVCGLMVKYVSAFANHEGGHIYFGIGDTRANVIGEEMNLRQQKDLEMLIANRMRLVIWRDMNIVTKRGVHWDINFYPVENSPKNSQRVVVVVSVVKFPGGVYTHCPVSTYVDGAGTLKEFTFSQWRDAVLNPLRDVPELHHRFEKLSLLVPRAPLVFSLPNTISSIINKCLLGTHDDIQPRLYIESFAKPVHREAIKTIINYFKGNNSVCFGLECWGLKIPMLQSEDIICDIAVISEIDSVLVLTLATMITPDVRQHAQIAATTLKNRLTQHGGCTQKLAVIAFVVNVNEQNVLEHLQQELAITDIYPSHFLSNKTKFQSILHASAITMGAYMAKSQVLTLNSQVGQYYFLLTHDQFELLWTQQFTRELWVHGPAGAGKTVAAIQMMQELCRRGCSPQNILYLAENENLATFVSNHNVCIVSTRRELLTDNELPDAMGRKYSQVCNVIVDEVQNFKDRDGDWYTLAQTLSKRPPCEQLRRCSNYFWIFMDYSQKVHKFKAGLPSVVGKNNFMLSEVSRSTREIFDFTSRLMMASENVEGLMSPAAHTLQTSVTPKLAHHFSSGKGVDIMSCKETEITGLLNQVLSGLLESGVRTEDIAILVGKQKELDHLQPTLSQLSAQMPMSVSGTLLQDIPTRRSVEEHLQKCGSDRSVEHHRSSSRDKGVISDSPLTDGHSEAMPSPSYMDDLEEVSSEDELDLSNPFNVLAGQDTDNDSAIGGSKGSLTQEDLAGETIVDKMEDSQSRHVDQSSASTKNIDNVNVVSDGSVSAAQGDISRGSRDRKNSDKGEEAVKFYHGEGSREASMDRDSMRSDRGEFSWSRQNSNALDPDHIAIDTVRRFSGLDKSAVIGVNPYVNEEHADFKKFMLSLATRAKDNLVIITTSDSIKKQLEKLVT